MPLVSIGMPVFNDKKYLTKALDSLLSQTYTDFELIISDDVSTDGSCEICKRYAAIDKRIRYIRQPENLGISRNMEFLLKEAKGKYFMWAANDDYWDKDFVRILKENLEKNTGVVSSFCIFCQVDENEKIIEGKEEIIENYSANSKVKRLRKLINQFSDGFGYGLFVRNEIIDVHFPIWWGVNRKCAYNNIYPTLCFYLTKGKYVLYNEKVLWYNRIKNSENVHHKIPYYNSFIKGFIAYMLRKMNLVIVSIVQIIRSEKSIATAISVLPLMLYKWFLLPCYSELRNSYKRYLIGEKKFF